jgi:Mg2+ and Co2+ transporter CorA
MVVRTYLYDATATDREVELDGDLVAGLHDKQLLWIDLSAFDEEELRRVAALLKLTRESVFTLLQKEHRPRLDNYGRYSQMNINTLQETDGRYRAIEVDFVLMPNIVMTVHRQPVNFLASFDRRVKSDSALGELDAASFLAGLLDWHVTGYFRLVEDLEGQIDRIDAHALRPRHRRDLLSEMAKLRQRVALVRRVLNPHREVYAAMARPEFLGVAGSESGPQFMALGDRLERAIEAVENARELLIGSFDMFTTQTTLRTSEVMKMLTLVSFIWFPASVIVSITAMVLQTPVHPMGTPGFWVMILIITLIGFATLIYARWKHWI